LGSLGVNVIEERSLGSMESKRLQRINRVGFAFDQRLRDHYEWDAFAGAAGYSGKLATNTFRFFARGSRDTHVLDIASIMEYTRMERTWGENLVTVAMINEEAFIDVYDLRAVSQGWGPASVPLRIGDIGRAFIDEYVHFAIKENKNDATG